MNDALKNIDIELAKIWLAGQDLSQMPPEQVKVTFYDALYKILNTKIEK